MDLKEYNKVKNLTYLEYCDYLQNKYGIGLGPYFKENWVKNPKITRTKEGLFAHHKYEDHAIMLSTLEYAKNNPYEWQLPENLVYCNYLEHLLLHILICQYPAKNKNKHENVGYGGVVNFLVPELNDVYSGFMPVTGWKIKPYSVIKDHKDVYLQLIKKFKNIMKYDPNFTPLCLLSSWPYNKDLWSINNNLKLFNEILDL